MRYKNACLNLPDEMLTRLDAEAVAAHRSRSFLVREIIQRHLDTNAKPYRASDQMNALHETTPAEKESLHVA